MSKTALLISLCAIATFTACTSKEEEKNEEGTFSITSPLVMDTSYTKQYVAQIQSIQNVEIHAMVEGFIETINVDEGQQVKTGQVLLRIMPKEYEAELQKAKAETKTAELEMLNTKTLADKNIVSQTELALAQAKFDQAKAEVARAELFVSWTEIKAPFDGVIDRIRFKVGSLIDKGTLLTTISNNKDVYAYFNVSEVDYLDYNSRKKNNSKDSATLLLANFQQHKYKGCVETIEGEFNNETGNIAFRAKFPNPDLLLKHGETGKVLISIPLKQAVIIPQKATFDVLDKKFVYVVDENNVVKSRQVVVAQEMSHLYIIASGLDSKDKILAEGLGKVKNNEKIESKFTPIEKVISELNNLHAE
jgi:membrane fusion protein, multidrug efflux system